MTGKSKANAARSIRANAVMKFSPLLASIRSNWRWASREVIDDRVGEIEKLLAQVDFLAFELAQDIASGRVELNLPDEPRPLFDRPSKPVVEVDVSQKAQPPPETPGYVPGTNCVQCTHCHVVRLVAGARCPWCGNPEYSLMHVDQAGAVVSGWPEPATTPKARKPKKADPIPPEDWEIPAPTRLCLTCNKTYPMSQVGCPDCLHGPIKLPVRETEPEAASHKPRKPSAKKEAAVG
jgi:hypothetical protein